MQTLAERILSRVEMVDKGHGSPCWISNRATQPNGYTKIGIKGHTNLTHRVAYQEFIGAIPPGLQLDHLCRQRACCNPSHLEPVDCRTNLLRGDTITAREAAQTHCGKGHPFDDANTYRRRDRPNSRGCRTCRLEAKRAVA